VKNTIQTYNCAGIIDYTRIMQALKGYKAPHRTISYLLKKGDLIRVKKGLYVLGDRVRTGLVSKELLSNLIYGPSYISQEYALSFYGLIPEKVEAITSMTPKKNKLFKTPVGVFLYRYLNSKLYSLGVTSILIQPECHVLIATPEKALIDTLMQIKLECSIDGMREHLTENLRIELDDLKKLDKDFIKWLSDQYRHPTPSLLYDTIKWGIT
jgi:predicted transcriptional regulator of viral defense system